MAVNLQNAIIGCLLGTAVGDALGLPMEGLSRRRQRKMFPEVEGYHFLFGKGMISDDTEHTCMVAQAMIASGGDEHRFARDLSWRMRKWLLGLPAGVGFATLRSLLKLWMGFSPEHSGVFSAGNGPAMRSAIIGVCFGDDKKKLASLVRISTRITHTDPKSEYGALSVALAAHMAGRHENAPGFYLRELQVILGPGASELLALVKRAVESATDGQTTGAFAAELGLGNGVGGYIYHTVPVVLHAWFRHPGDYLSGIREAIECGGDTDTVAAILGGILGAAVGKDGIPSEMIKNLWGWPVTHPWMESLGRALGNVVSNNEAEDTPEIFFLSSLLRNLFFLLIVLCHGFRRIFPPY
ncbi:MAG: ADP-ribosylglycohydrolase family protein [Deltaproteobacteria bacterium]|nr:ADP-ribosylglycohydrolase family protein [Deltaproteobacteria bacterium]